MITFKNEKCPSIIILLFFSSLILREWLFELIAFSVLDVIILINRFKKNTDILDER